MNLASRKWLTALVWCGAAGVACSATGGGGSGGTPGGAGAGAGGAAASTGSGGSSAGPGTGGGNGLGGGNGFDAGGSTDGSSLKDGEACTGTNTTAKPTPLGVMVMFDQSSSMVGARWNAIVKSLKDFTTSPEAAGIRIALNYFALTKPCSSNSDCKSSWGKCGSTGFCTFDDYCDAAAYETPEVDFSELPGAAAAIAASLDKHAPLFNTTSPPALEGALRAARTRAAAVPQEKVVVVLMTDGEPDSITCGFGNKDAPLVVSAAQAGLAGSPSIPTYVIGVGNKVGNLNAVAAAGGTGKAYMVDGGGGAATQQQFVAALNAIRGSALPCSYTVPPPPPGETLDYDKVNVVFTPDGGSTETIGMVPGVADCGPKGGWYYDNPAQPSSIMVCPATCDVFHGGASGSVDIQLGCDTVIQIK